MKMVTFDSIVLVLQYGGTPIGCIGMGGVCDFHIIFDIGIDYKLNNKNRDFDLNRKIKYIR